MVLDALNEFRCSVRGRTARGQQQAVHATLRLGAKTEINYFQVLFLVQEHVLGFEVTVSVTVVVQVRYGRYDLPEEHPRFHFAEAALLDNVVEQLAARTVLHDHVAVGLGLDHLVQLADIGMGQALERADLELDARQVLAQLGLVHDLDGHLLAGQSVRGKFDFAEAAGADGAVQLVAAGAQRRVTRHVERASTRPNPRTCASAESTNVFRKYPTRRRKKRLGEQKKKKKR